MSVLCVSPSVCVSVCMFVCLSVGPSMYVCLSTYVDVCVSVCSSVWVSVCVYLNATQYSGAMLNKCSLLVTAVRARHSLHLNEYHEWFTKLVADWLDAAADKCNVEIKRAVTGLDDVMRAKSCTV